MFPRPEIKKPRVVYPRLFALYALFVYLSAPQADRSRSKTSNSKNSCQSIVFSPRFLNHCKFSADVQQLPAPVKDFPMGSCFKITDRAQGQGASRRKTQHTREYVSIFRRLATPSLGVRWGFEIASKPLNRSALSIYPR